MTNTPRKSFKEMRAEIEAQKGVTLSKRDAPSPVAEIKPSVDADLIPDVHDERAEDDINVDRIIEAIDILDAYRRWIGKEVDEKTTGQTEGIKVSCPNPSHRDKNPSAWLNSDKKTWYCAGCDEGGDIYDFGAIKFGYDRPGYKEGQTFHALRKDMAEAYGYRFKTVAGTEVIWQEEEVAAVAPASDGDSPASPAESTDTGEPVPEPTAAQAGAEPAQVTVLHAQDVEDEEETTDWPVLNWKKIVPKNTFLYEYLDQTSRDDSPEEYHFWHGLLALGHATGRNVYLADTRPVFGNLLVCLLGGTGFGKSRSRAWLDEVLVEACPFQDSGLDTSGVKIVPTPASGENLIKQFQHLAYDPSLGKNQPTIYTPVNGIVDYDEFAGLLARAGRQGSTLKPIIMGFSDAKSKVSTSSNTSGEFIAERPFCSITASTQPKAVRVLLTRTDTGSGFLNRWIFVGGPPKQREVIGGVRSGIRVDLDEAIALLKKVRAWGGIEREIHFTDEGYDAFEDFMRSTVFPIQQADDTDLLTRLDLTLKRLILLFCINEKKLAADADVVNRVKPMLKYLIRCYSILNAEIGISLMSEITTEILRHVERIQQQTGRGATARDLGQRMKRKNYSPDLIKKALETMVALDWLDLEKPTKQGPGRPTIRYKVVS